MSIKNEADILVEDENAVRTVRRPSFCWQGLLCLGLAVAWNIILVAHPLYPSSFTATDMGMLTHFLVVGTSIAFGIAEIWKLKQERDSTLGLILAMTGIIWATVITYQYLYTWKLLGSSEF